MATKANDSPNTRTADKATEGDAQKPARQAPSPASGDLQQVMDEAEQKGYLGSVPDGLPNSAYSMEGGAPKPITNEDQLAAEKDTDADDDGA